MSLSKKINPSLVLVQPRKTRPFLIERLLMGRKESNQSNKQTNEVDASKKCQVSLVVKFSSPLAIYKPHQ